MGGDVVTDDLQGDLRRPLLTVENLDGEFDPLTRVGRESNTPAVITVIGPFAGHFSMTRTAPPISSGYIEGSTPNASKTCIGKASSAVMGTVWQAT
ncbi:MAG: hypothetical protein ACR2MR_12270 [Dietzia maris]